MVVQIRGGLPRVVQRVSVEMAALPGHASGSQPPRQIHDSSTTTPGKSFFLFQRQIKTIFVTRKAGYCAQGSQNNPTSL